MYACWIKTEVITCVVGIVLLFYSSFPEERGYSYVIATISWSRIMDTGSRNVTMGKVAMDMMDTQGLYTTKLKVSDSQMVSCGSPSAKLATCKFSCKMCHNTSSPIVNSQMAELTVCTYCDLAQKTNIIVISSLLPLLYKFIYTCPRFIKFSSLPFQVLRLFYFILFIYSFIHSFIHLLFFSFTYSTIHRSGRVVKWEVLGSFILWIMLVDSIKMKDSNLNIYPLQSKFLTSGRALQPWSVVDYLKLAPFLQHLPCIHLMSFMWWTTPKFSLLSPL